MPNKKENIKWLISLSILIVAICQFIILYKWYNIDSDTTIIDTTASVLLLFLGAWMMQRGVHVYPTRVGVIIYSLLLAVIVSLAITSTSIFLITQFADKEHHAFVKNSAPIRHITTCLLMFLAAVYFALTKRINKLEKEYKRKTDNTTLLKDAELFKLRQQLQPHFLYNSLNSISALTLVEPSKAQHMIKLLSDFLRTSVQRETKSKISLEEEINYFKNYLEIEMIRFGDRLNVSFTNTVDLDAELPPFLLQPIIENAIKFGLYGTSGKVDISINISMNDKQLAITTTNPYSKDNTPPKGTGFGLSGISRRLYLIYARTDLLETVEEENTFTTILIIPQNV